MDNKNGYLFRLIIKPKELNHLKNRDWVTDLIQLQPTGGHDIGDITTASKYNSNTQYNPWSWEFGIEMQEYLTGKSDISFSENFYAFLQSLPSANLIWTQLNEYCECSLFISIERSHFLTEIEFENNNWAELAKRNLKLQISAMTKQGGK